MKNQIALLSKGRRGFLGDQNRSTRWILRGGDFNLVLKLVAGAVPREPSFYCKTNLWRKFRVCCEFGGTAHRSAVEKCTEEDQEPRWMEVGFRTPFSFPYLEVLLVLVSVANTNFVLLYFIHIYLKLVGGIVSEGAGVGHWHLRFSCISLVFNSYF